MFLSASISAVVNRESDLNASVSSELVELPFPVCAVVTCVADRVLRVDDPDTLVVCLVLGILKSSNSSELQ